MYGPGNLSSWSIRNKLLLLVLIVFLPASGIIIASGLERRAHEIEKAKDNALLLVESLAAQQEQVVIGTEQMLSTLAQLPEVQTRDVEACSALFRKLHAQHPFYSTIAAATPEGDVFASSNPAGPDPVNLADRKHVRDAIRTRAFSAGEYVVGRTSKVPSINYTYPILDEDRNLIGVVIAGFKLDEYARFLSKVNLLEGSAVVITDHKGVRLYRLPENAATALGKPIPEDSFKRITGDQDQGAFERVGEDGIERIYCFKQLRLGDSLPPYLYMLVGIPEDALLHQANRDMLRNLSVLGMIALAAVGLAWVFGNRVLAGPINQLVRATELLAVGEMGTRTGLPHTPDELGQLAKSFDEMTSMLEHRAAELERANEELRAHASKLERSNRDLEDFAFIASHDLQEPLRKIQTFCDLARTRCTSTPDGATRGYLERVTNSAGRMRQLLDDLLQFSRVAAKPEPFKAIDLGRIVREAADLFAEDLKESGGRVEIGDLPAIAADETQMLRLFQNLIGNGLKYRSDNSPLIKIYAKPDGGRCEIFVEDNGIGFDQQFAQRIFKPFQRLHGRTEYQGTGMGLAICRKIVELHGGSIRAESVPGKGSTFIIRLPVKQDRWEEA